MAAPKLAADLAAYDEQASTLADHLAAMPAAAWAADTVLPGWTLHTLVGHLARSKEGLVTPLARPGGGTAAPAGQYVRAYAPAAAEIAAAAEGFARDREPAVLLAALQDPTPVPALADTAVVIGPRGPITAIDFVRTRLLDLVVHADDVSRSFPDDDPVPLRRPALAAAVRIAAIALTQQAPGRSVEVRVPPFVAVQAVAGPRHTRGTPPNTVETDPVTWLRLATGRLGFAAALADGRVQATGARGDLTAFLPLLA